MKNKYIWLYKNLDKYKYNTKEARELCEQYRALGSKADPERYAVSQELENCYDNFVRLFNNNPYDYKCGFSRFAIETEEMDAGFIFCNDEWFPVGYYQSIRPVESAILTVNKTRKDREHIKNDAPVFMNSIEKATQRAEEGYSAVGTVKKASYIRGVLFLIAGLWCVIASLRFFIATDLFGIIKNTIEGGNFLTVAGNAMEKYPLLPFNNGMLWIFVALIYLLVMIIVLVNVKKAFTEIDLAHKKHITQQVGGSLKKTKNVIDSYFDDEVENTYGQLTIASMKAGSCDIKRGRIAHNVMNTVNSIETSHEFVALPASGMRALKNGFVLVLTVLAVINSFAFNSKMMAGIYDSIDKSMYSFKVNREYGTLRSRKMAQCVGEFDAPVYTKTDLNSNVKYYVPLGNEVDIVKTVTENDVEWCKIKYITETEFIEGWVLKSFLNLNYDNNILYKYVSPYDTWASHILQGNNTYYPEYTYDRDRKSSWQYSEDEDPYSEKSITYEFEDYVDIDAIRISIGNGRNDSLYYRNRRPENITIKFSQGDTVKYNFDDTVDFQMIRFNKRVRTQRITIVIDSTYSHCPEEYAYEGTYADVCINEVEILQEIHTEDISQ